MILFTSRVSGFLENRKQQKFAELSIVSNFYNIMWFIIPISNCAWRKTGASIIYCAYVLPFWPALIIHPGVGLRCYLIPFWEDRVCLLLSCSLETSNRDPLKARSDTVKFIILVIRCYKTRSSSLCLFGISFDRLSVYGSHAWLAYSSNGLTRPR